MKHWAKHMFRAAAIFCIAAASPFSTSAQFTDTTNVVGQLTQYLLYRNHDTNYISNYADEISVKVLANNKFNYFRIRDKEAGESLRYRPSRDVSLGLGVAYKWFALDLAFALGLRNNSQIEGAKAFDFQGRFYTSRQLMSFSLQYYQGFKLANISWLDVDLGDDEVLRSDIRTLNFGLEYFYALNYTKFSMKAPFVFNEIQRKSAGSPIVGAIFGIYSMSADSNIIPTQARGTFQTAAQMRDFTLINGALNVGYMYTFVYKDHYFISLGLIPGLNFSGGDYFNSFEDRRTAIPLNAHLKINSLNSIGYNGRNFFGGITFMLDATNARMANRLIGITGRGMVNLFVGYRFKPSALKKPKTTP